MGDTIENLNEAFAGESKANRLYLAFSRKADAEGLNQVARLFKAAAEAEAVHALNHLNVLGKIGSTAENLDTAIRGETAEFTEMYPEYLSVAREEGNRRAAWSFDVANKVEKIHAGLFSEAIEAVRSKKDLPEVDYYVCQVCGNTVEREAPDKCPICGAPKTAFLKID
jgi:rubrerythrin